MISIDKGVSMRRCFLLFGFISLGFLSVLLSAQVSADTADQVRGCFSRTSSDRQAMACAMGAMAQKLDSMDQPQSPATHTIVHSCAMTFVASFELRKIIINSQGNELRNDLVKVFDRQNYQNPATACFNEVLNKKKVVSPSHQTQCRCQSNFGLTHDLLLEVMDSDFKAFRTYPLISFGTESTNPAIRCSDAMNQLALCNN